jgi:hypothetical protein
MHEAYANASNFEEAHSKRLEIKITDAPRPFREELAKVGLSDALKKCRRSL